MNNTIIHCPTEAEYRAIVDKFGWDGGENYYDYWDKYKKETAVRVKNNKIYTLDELVYYKIYYLTCTFLTAEEVLKEDRLKFSGAQLQEQKTNNNTTMSNVTKWFREMTATKDEKLLKKYGLEDPIGTPTEKGLELSAEITYKANREEVIKIVNQMEKEETNKEDK